MVRFLFLFILLLPASPLLAVSHSSNNVPYTQNDTVYYIPAVIKETARLYSDKDNASSVIMYVPADSAVMIIDTAGSFFLVHYKDLDGFVRQNRVRKYKEVLYELTAPPGENMTEPQNRHDLLIAKYGQKKGKDIYEHKIWKGMNSEMVLDSWGKPKVINHYDTGNGFREEWVYPKYVLSFSNGILTGWISR
jgi:hypothetical protein